MTRQLPQRPDLDQLRYQAKDLLKAHRSGDPSCCDRLRHLARFEDESDEEILANRISLQEVQFALAMDYGFSAWSEIKQVITRRSDSGSTIVREGDKTWISGIPPLSRHEDSRQATTGKTSVIAVLARCLQALGENATYEYLMGVSSHAFRFQFDWCPSAPHSFCGFNTAVPALEAVGYTMKQYSTARPSHRDDLDEPCELSDAFKAVMLSIEMGIPGLMDWEESTLLAGYEKPGMEITGLLGPNGEPVKKLPWSVGILSKARAAPPRRRSIVWSLTTAVSQSHSHRLSGASHDEQKVMSYPAGFTAWEKWISELVAGADGVDPSDACLGNAWTYECLIDARRAAAGYLRSVTSDFPEAATQLKAAAEQYANLSQKLDEGWQFIRYPWQMNTMEEWSGEMRERQASILKDALLFERQAVLALEHALDVIN